MKQGLLVILMLQVWMSGAHGQSQPDFISAYPEEDGLRFGVKTDWPALVPDSIRVLEAEFEKEGNRQRIWDRRNRYDDSNFSYRHDLTAELADGFWYLITTTGVFPLELSHLRGVVRFSTGGRGAEDLVVHSVAKYGYAIGSVEAEDGRGRGGFVLHTDTALDIRTAASNVTASALLDKPEMSDDERTFRRIQNQYSFEISGETYVLVKWVADDACFEVCCQNRFSLFKTEVHEVRYQRVAWTSFACDV